MNKKKLGAVAGVFAAAAITTGTLAYTGILSPDMFGGRKTVEVEQKSAEHYLNLGKFYVPVIEQGVMRNHLLVDVGVFTTVQEIDADSPEYLLLRDALLDALYDVDSSFSLERSTDVELLRSRLLRAARAELGEARVSRLVFTNLYSS